jgi:hypothetical protein
MNSCEIIHPGVSTTFYLNGSTAHTAQTSTTPYINPQFHRKSKHPEPWSLFLRLQIKTRLHKQFKRHITFSHAETQTETADDVLILPMINIVSVESSYVMRKALPCLCISFSNGDTLHECYSPKQHCHSIFILSIACAFSIQRTNCTPPANPYVPSFLPAQHCTWPLTEPTCPWPPSFFTLNTSPGGNLWYYTTVNGTGLGRSE